MAHTPRERLAKLVDGAESTGAFSLQLLAPADCLDLEVKGVGQIRLPVRAPQARKLCDVARPARFGRGEQTLTDPGVRDSWEIPPELVTVTGPRWAATVEGVLHEVRERLGLPLSSRLEAGLHAMLVYGPGQFFLPHQDSEKDDAMIGTLVVTLPSSHAGGELIVEHGGESVTYRSSKDSLSFVAFYADCRHEVKPVKSGYRVTLTFNLLAHRDGMEPAADQPVAELTRCLTEHFTTRASKRYGTGDLDPPNRLVYLLDHEYTERGLSWNRLKGADIERATLLRATADQADCEAVLALAEVKETWDCDPSEDQWDDHDYYDEDGDGDGDDPDPDGYELTDLIDSEISLGWWTNPSGKGGESISLHVSDFEVCATTPSVDLKPYQSEYEGYMGNYGNTMDRWYRRAAVVMWPRERAFAARAEASASWALRELRARIHTGDLTGARAAAESLAPIWDSTARAKPPLLESALDVATSLDEPSTAALLLHPFKIESLAPEHATAVADLVARYGEPWTITVLDAPRGWLATVARVAELRADTLHKATSALAARYETVVVENLGVTGMLANRSLARAVADQGFGATRRMLDYKTGWAGGRLIVADRWFPSSKICSGCGRRKPSLTLSERIFRCDACGLSLGRDVNAAINLRDLAASGAERLNACGGDVRPGTAGQTPVKQEPGTTPAGSDRDRRRETDGCLNTLTFEQIQITVRTGSGAMTSPYASTTPNELVQSGRYMMCSPT